MASLQPIKEERPAAQYLRMSTEHQRYSTTHQAAAIERYAQARGYRIVQTYSDEGISGVSIKNRKGLQQLLADILGGAASYEVVLVYDVSRWGRFQNPDQSAHYEFLCAEAGVHVEYCAELFENDGSLSSTLLKSLKRVMAAEYSRELSVKVADAHLRLTMFGYWQGGPAGYGFRRRALAPDGRKGPVMEHGEFKGVHGHRTVLVPGPPHELETVTRIFRLYAYAGMTHVGIARLLNSEGTMGEAGNAWTAVRIRRLLASRKYIGDIEYRKSGGGLGVPRFRKAKAEWICVPGAIEPIVSKRLFAAAQQATTNRNVRLSTEGMRQALHKLYEQHGQVTHRLIRETPGLPRGAAFRRRFGSMAQASAAVGRPRSEEPKWTKVSLDNATILERLKTLYGRERRLDSELIDAEPTLPSARTISRRFGGLDQAYFLVGYDNFSPGDLASKVGRARAEALAIRRARALGLLLEPRDATAKPPRDS